MKKLLLSFIVASMLFTSGCLITYPFYIIAGVGVACEYAVGNFQSVEGDKSVPRYEKPQPTYFIDKEDCHADR